MAQLNNAGNQSFTNNTTGWTLAGGNTTVRSLSISGSTGNIILTNPNAGPSTFTFPNQTTDTLLGSSAFTAAGTLLYGSGANTFSTLSAGTSGQFLQSTGSAVQWVAIPPAVTWNAVAGTTQTIAIANGYISNNVALTTFTLPTVAAVGSSVAVVGAGAGGWTIGYGAGASIIFGNTTSTTATGSLASTQQRDVVYLLCVVANTTWQVTTSIGNLLVT
jgi:hypothetical protein